MVGPGFASPGFRDHFLSTIDMSIVIFLLFNPIDFVELNRQSYVIKAVLYGLF